MVIIMLLATQIPTEMSKMLKRERRAQDRVPFLLGPHSYTAKNKLPKQQTQTKCRTETQDEQPPSRKREHCHPFHPLGMKEVLKQSAESLKLRG